MKSVTNMNVLLMLLLSGVAFGQDCSDPEWNEESDAIEDFNYHGSAFQCDILISDNRIDVDEDDDVSIECNTGISGAMGILSECRWYSPEGDECIWNTEDGENQSGNYCGSDSSVQFIGRFTSSSCDIRINEIEERHSGLWKCVAGTGAGEWVDNIDVVTDGGLSTEAIVGITVPICLIVLLIIILLLILLLCPQWYDRCRRKREDKNEQTSNFDPEPRMGRAQAPTPMAAPPIYRPEVEESVYEVTDASDMTSRPLRDLPSTASSSNNYPGNNTYDQVSYMQPRVTAPNETQYGPTKTAKKISNMSLFRNSNRRDSYQ